MENLLLVKMKQGFVDRVGCHVLDVSHVKPTLSLVREGATQCLGMRMAGSDSVSSAGEILAVPTLALHIVRSCNET